MAWLAQRELKGTRTAIVNKVSSARQTMIGGVRDRMPAVVTYLGIG
jgi:hypothetical protein